MKKVTKAGSALMLAALLALTACNKKAPATQVKPNGLPAAGAKVQGGEIAFVDVDTLAAQYEYCKDGQKALAAKQESFEKQYNAKLQAYQNAMTSYQQKVQSGAITNEQQAQPELTKIQNLQKQGQQFETRMQNEMAAAAQEYQKVLRDSINSFLADYNKDGRFKMILSKSGDNILYADKALDITQDVVAGLNKRYKK